LKQSAEIRTFPFGKKKTGENPLLYWIALVVAAAVAVLDMHEHCPKPGRQQEKSEIFFRAPG
jgi:hypothetical protein